MTSDSKKKRTRSRRFEFLSTEAFSRLLQREKIDYLSRATLALGRTLSMDAVRLSGPGEASPGTLGAVLYPDSTRSVVPEAEWVVLVESVTAGDQLALHALYERAHQSVFSLLATTFSREVSGELMLDVFCDVWRQSPRFDSVKETVLGWIMNLAQARASQGFGLEQRNRRNASSGEVPASLQRRLALRMAEETGGEAVLPPPRQWHEPKWEQVAPGISCKLLSTDTVRHRVSMQVRLAPGGDYPPHTHAGVEELHLLDGEIWIDDRKLHPGDHNRAEPGTGDKRVWSETGCSCVLITSTDDILS